ncbi:MAG: UDP-N-acetylmuramoyl-tripeptide--D-alanyl-D-alanine ligase [Bacilli bacterium]|nr:UDP-N-acetylmuramoyl-tripeptide--D-alanyl-D-alanine ligase [Bacilli bacterium]
MKVNDILKVKDTKLINGDLDCIVNFSINTSEINGNTIFIPLQGNTDGHNYIINGVKNGISGFLVMPGHEEIIKEALELNKDLIIVQVPDCLKTLQDLARETRKSTNVPVIALTGSFGKTSQREMIYSVLKEEFNVLTTKGNYNNHIGMPLTLVNYNNEDVILLELGTNHMGEIAILRDICLPTITVVTNVGTAHIGNFKKLKNTLKEKISITKGSKYFLRNMDDEMIKKVKVKVPNIIEYGINDENISNIVYGNKNRYAVLIDGQKYKVNINSDIDYLINYSICAMKIGLLLNMDIKNIIKGIDRFRCAPSRMDKRIIGENILIDDCYNASFETMISGLDYFWKQPNENKIAILGDILELGKASKKIHKDIANYIVDNNLRFDEIHLVGSEMKNVFNILEKNNFNVYYYNNIDEVDPTIMENKSVYLKSSHGTGLYKIVPKKEN